MRNVLIFSLGAHFSEVKYLFKYQCSPFHNFLKFLSAHLQCTLQDVLQMYCMKSYRNWTKTAGNNEMGCMYCMKSFRDWTITEDKQSVLLKLDSYSLLKHLESVWKPNHQNYWNQYISWDILFPLYLCDKGFLLVARKWAWMSTDPSQG